jgi:hypothetical protein
MRRCFCDFDGLLYVQHNLAWTRWLRSALVRDYTRIFAAFCELHIYAVQIGTIIHS